MAKKKKVPTPPTQDPSGEFVVAVLRDRWVFVGFRRREGDQIIMERARCVRVWGTAGDHTGLATLAAKGPTDSTVIEDPSTIKFHLLAETFSHEADRHALAWRREYP
jgi:hypothetical protein